MIDIALVKTHLKIDPDFNDGDDYINHLITAAEQEFEFCCNRTLIAESETLPDPVGNAIKLNQSIIQGALMLIGHWHNNREAVIVGVGTAELPLSTRQIWAKYRWYSL